jgi:hypothetical protein
MDAEEHEEAELERDASNAKSAAPAASSQSLS